MSKRPGDELTSAVEKQTAINAGAMQEEDAGYDTVVYNEPLPSAPAPAATSIGNLVGRPNSIFAGAPLPMGGPGYVPPDFAASRAREASRAAILAGGRQAAQRVIDSLPADVQQTVSVYTSPATGLSYLRNKPLPIDRDPLVQQLAVAQADIQSKINSLIPQLTIKQQDRIKRRWESITHVRKGKEAGKTKVPTTDQLQKVLFQTLEMHASRRAAQLSAQARRAKRERHALMQRNRPIALEDGTTVGINKRYFKKIASNSVRKAGVYKAKQDAKAVRMEITAANKARRVAIAQSHNRKVNPKDRLPPKQ